jgi:hypothetical protein
MFWVQCQCDSKFQESNKDLNCCDSKSVKNGLNSHHAAGTTNEHENTSQGKNASLQEMRHMIANVAHDLKTVSFSCPLSAAHFSYHSLLFVLLSSFTM